MQKLFGGGLLESAVPAAKRNTLPASATAAIAAVAATAAAAATAATASLPSSGGKSCRDTDDPKTVSIEWDFGDDADPPPPPVEPRSGSEMSAAVASAAAADAAADAARPKAGKLGLNIADSSVFFGKEGGRLSPARASPPSTEAVTPKARGGGSGMWAEDPAGGVGYRSLEPSARKPERVMSLPRYASE